jgi:acetyltransferase-like isoleucine patch superfamily enzyme
MLKIILQDRRQIHPFNERARDLRVQNKPLWLSQRDVLAPHTDRELELPPGKPLPDTSDECLVYRDNLYFNPPFVAAFLNEAKSRGRACQVALSLNDPAFREHALPLSTSYRESGDIYLVDMWYYPKGIVPDADPVVINMEAIEVGYYHVPTYMAYENGDLVFQVPRRSLIAIDSWVHIFIADMVYGLFTRGARFEARLKEDLVFKLRILVKAMYEGVQVLGSSDLVTIGRNCVIDPHAIIHGPTTIGDNVTINAGAVIENCIIGNNVNISQDCQLMLSVIGDGCFLPFRASLFMTTLMDNTMVAQNTCLQMCVIGRNTFIGAGTTFTDFNLLSTPIQAIDGNNQLNASNRIVLGGCVGHNCRLGSGMIIFPARTVESDVVIIASDGRREITQNVRYEDSDHHRLPKSHLHPRLYPRVGEVVEESW